MFFLGLLVGVVVMLGAFGWLVWLGGQPSVPLFDGRAAIRAQERRTINDLLSAEQAMRHTGSRTPGTDIIEGTAVEVDRP